MTEPTTPIDAEWVHVTHTPLALAREVYGFAGSQGVVNLEGIRFRPADRRSSRTLLVYMHPASTLQLLPMPRAMAQAGQHVLCAASRYARNDTPLVMEQVALDLGAWIRHARDAWGYHRVVLVGWSGGGSLALLYQSQAERPTITTTPAGDPCDLVAAKLPPADALMFQAAHLSRAQLLADWIDPSVLDEHDPDRRDPELDLYDPRNPHRPPYAPEYLARFRAAQLARLRRRTAWVRETLDALRRRGGREDERPFVTHRTLAEPRFLDPTLDPNERVAGSCFLGDPEQVNAGPIALGRFSTLRAWLSQWSIDDTNADAERCARSVTVPLLAMENGADDAVPAPHVRAVHDAAGSADRSFVCIAGANHYYAGQPEKLAQAREACLGWLRARGLAD